MKTILSLIISATLVVSGYSQTRNVLVGTNNAVVQPTNFWSADASNARSGLGLGTAATNPASAFQPSSATLSNLATGNGGGLTNISATIVGTNISITNVVGLQSALDSKLATNGSAAGLISFPTLNQNTTGTASNVTGVVALANGGTGSTNASDARAVLGLGTAATSATTAFQPATSALTNLAANNGGGLTNLQATNLVGMIPASNISTITISNVGGTLPITQGGTGATNASGARTALELGTAATNPSTAFQAASSALTNLSSNNGASLTNLTAANVTGTVGLASNVTGVVALANGGTAGTNATTARTSLGATTIGANLFTLANPDDTRFIRLNANNSVSSLTAADMRTALSVGTNLGTVTSVGMTVPNIFSLSGSTITSSGTFALTLANQSSRQAFLVPNGGGIPAFRGIESDDLPSLAISKITGLQTAIDGKLATNGTAPLAVNVTGTVAVANGGTGGTTAESGRTGLGATTIGSGLFTLANPSSIRFIRLNADNTVSSLSDSDFRTAIGLGTAATNSASSFQASSANLTSLAANNGANLTNIPLSGVVNALASNGNGFALTNLNASNITGTIPASNISSVTFSNLAGTLAIASGGTAATNAGGARTNLGLGWSALTNTNAATSLIGFTTNNQVVTGPDFLQFTNEGVTFNVASVVSNLFLGDGSSLVFDGDASISLGTALTKSNFRNELQIGWAGTNAATTRTNLGLAWSALTNTNTTGFNSSLYGSGTNPVLVSTSGVVVSPTNFWQVAPIQTLVQDLTVVVTTQTNNATNARNLYVYSLATNVSGISNTILLPTNAATFAGDEVTVIHQGTTNTTTVVRQAGSTNNLITLNRFDEAVKFIRESGRWDFYHNISHVEPIQFSGTNAAANAVASRINLGFNQELSNLWTATNAATAKSAIGLVGSGSNSFLGGGISNTATSSNAFVGAGINNVASGNRSFIGGGVGNSASTLNAVVVGGNGNLSSGIASFVGGGELNTASGGVACVTVGGSQNINSADYGTIIGGYLAEVTAQYGVALGGSRNRVTGEFSMAAGRRANATNAGSFVWSDNENVEFYSTNTNSFNIRARGGMSVDLGTSGIIFRAGAEQTRTNLGLGLPALTNSNTTNFQAAVFQTNTAPVEAAFNNIVAWMEVHVFTNGSNTSFRIPLFK